MDRIVFRQCSSESSYYEESDVSRVKLSQDSSEDLSEDSSEDSSEDM